MVKIYQYCKDKPYNQLSVNQYWLNSLPTEQGHLKMIELIKGLNQMLSLLKPNILFKQIYEFLYFYSK